MEEEDTINGEKGNTEEPAVMKKEVIRRMTRQLSQMEGAKMEEVAMEARYQIKRKTRWNKLRRRNGSRWEK